MVSQYILVCTVTYMYLIYILLYPEILRKPSSGWRFLFFGRVVQPVDSSVYANSIFLDKEGVKNYLVMYCTSDQF